MNFFPAILVLVALPVTIVSAPAESDADAWPHLLTPEMATDFAEMALKCIEKEYPNKPGHVMNDASEVRNPAALHPAFYGCFDWHSAVHGHWMLVRLLKLFPDLPADGRIREALNRNLTAENIQLEVSYFETPGRQSFERTYGWAWLLKLCEELLTWDDPDGRRWSNNLRPLEMTIVRRYLDFLPKQNYPIRTGVHPNTAFGLAFALDYARTSENLPLEKMIIETSREYYLNDRSCPLAWEPGGEDFFSPCLMEADLMLRVLNKDRFQTWFARFLPELMQEDSAGILVPATVLDRSDGKLVHLDGLNLSRAWCLLHIASHLPCDSLPRERLIGIAGKHARSALLHIRSGDYAGEHWLASFAVFLLTTNPVLAGH